MLFDGEISTLEDLVHPMSPEEFFQYYSNQMPIFIRGGVPSRVAKLVDVGEISAIIQQGIHPDGRISIRKNGKEIPFENYSTGEKKPRIDPSRVRRLLNSGASLILNGIDEVHPGIGDLTHALELEFSANVWANAYVTSVEGGALDIHFDDHDVIILQVAGSKRWHLFGRTQEYPLHPGRSLGDAPTQEQEIAVLAAGEVLFIPRGVWHRAEVVDSTSFHITFGVGGVTGIDFVTNAIDELGREPLFRKYLPRLGDAEVLKEHESQLKAYLHHWVDRLSGKAFLDDTDAARRNRSRAILWEKVNIVGTTRLWIAVRRVPSADRFELNDTGIMQIGGETSEFDPTAAHILKIACDRRALTYDELVIQMHSEGSTAPQVELMSAIVQLLERGLLNADN